MTRPNDAARVTLRADLPPLARRRFLRGLRVALTLRHPGIARVAALERGGGDIEVTVEPHGGSDLGRLLRWSSGRRVGWPPGLSIAIAVGLCRSLDHLHSAVDRSGAPFGFRVGGFGPEQVRITAAGDVQLVPFRVRDPASRVRLGARERLGAAPDLAMDLHAVGVLLLELLTGRPLARAGLEVASVDAGTIRALLADVPEELAAVVADVLLSPEAFPSALHLAGRLRAWAFAHEIQISRARLRTLVSRPAARPDHVGRRVAS